jgi:hypothetical protein
MIKEFWLSLPVGNLENSIRFFEAIGFTIGGGQGRTPVSAPLRMGEKGVVVMLFERPVFQSFTNDKAPVSGCSVLLSVDAQSKEEVDAMVEKVRLAGGHSDHVPGEMTGNMYGCIFTDPDGHRWSVLYMKN